MSRRVPRIASADLCDHATDERVDRIWERIEADLPEGHVRAPRQRGAIGIMLVAAAFAAFGAGVFVGRSGSRPALMAISASPSTDRSETEVLAAGEEEKAFGLPGGGTITLRPGATVEMQHAGSDLTLKLVQGVATLETSQSNAAMLVGEARLNTQAGSTVRVSRQLDNVDVDVSRGSASIDTPAFKKDLGSGDNVSVPLHWGSSAAATAIAAARPHASAHHASDPPVVEAQVGPPAAAANDTLSDRAAADRILQSPGGFDVAIRQAPNATELYRVRDLARVAKQPEAADRALRRICDSFPNDQLADSAAHQLCADHPGPDGRQYCERDSKSRLYDPDGAACRQLRAKVQGGNKDEAVRLAEEYVKDHADGGQCKDEAQRIVADGVEPADPPPSAHTVDAGTKADAKAPSGK